MAAVPTGPESSGRFEAGAEAEFESGLANGGSAGHPAPAPEALGQAAAAYRDYLLAVAGRGLAPELKTKEGASDVVQEALLQAHRAAPRLEGRSEGEVRAWLRALVRRATARAARRYRRSGKRRLDREVPLDAPRGADDSAADGPAAWVACDTRSPGSEAACREEEAALRTALERLPARERLAVTWHHHEGCDFAEIGRRLGCTDSGARKLWLRALQHLRHHLDASGPSQ